MKIKFFSLFVLLACIFTESAYAQEAKKFIMPAKPDYSALQMTGVTAVNQVIDPLRIRLHDGRIAQLAGIDIPDLTPYDTGEIGLAAMELLNQTLTNKHVRLHQTKNSRKGRTNRMGYELAQVEERNAEIWLQGALIKNGLARVRPSTVNIEMAGAMLALEQEARAEKRGLWADEAYAVLTPENAEKGMNGWAIVEGTVKANAMHSNTVYLNFGQDWRKDFTVGIPSTARREMVNLGLNPLQFSGKRIRIRGWVENYNGPYIELMHPVWIEILPPQAEPSNLN